MQQFIDNHFILLSVIGIILCVSVSFFLGWRDNKPKRQKKTAKVCASDKQIALPIAIGIAMTSK